MTGKLRRLSIDRVPAALEPSARQAAAKAAANPGWLKEREGRLLFALAANAPPRGAIVEIGSAEGKSTIWLASGLLAGGARGVVYAIDPHASYLGRRNTHEEFLRNMERAQVGEVVVGLKMTSEAANKGWAEPVRLLFIDGDHAYASVRQDFELWSRHLVAGGLVAFHDCLRKNPGPTRVFFDGVVQGEQFSDFSLIGSIGYGMRAGAAEECGLSQNAPRRLLARVTLRLFLSALEAGRRPPKPVVNLLRALVPH